MSAVRGWSSNGWEAGSDCTGIAKNLQVCGAVKISPGAMAAHDEHPTRCYGAWRDSPVIDIRLSLDSYLGSVRRTNNSRKRGLYHAGATNLRGHGFLALFVGRAANAKVNVAVVHNSAAAATGQFKLRVVPSPSDADAAAKAKISIVAGRRDQNGGDVDKLIDGTAPRDADQPAENFFFEAGTAGGRLVMDLGSPTAIDQVNTYSWHTNTRAPQVYKLFGSDGQGERFNGEPGEGVDPEQAGWKLIAEVDTRPAGDSAEQGGQYGVSIFDSEGAIGPYRYLLFDISRTENDDPFGNTFFSEIDVVAGQSPAAEEPGVERIHRITMETDDATFTATIDTTDSPDLTKWANEELAPVVKDWYPKIVKMLPSDGFEAPREFSIRFSPEYRGVAATGGTRVTCATQWFNRNLEGEAKGAVVHELGARGAAVRPRPPTQSGRHALARLARGRRRRLHPLVLVRAGKPRGRNHRAEFCQSPARRQLPDHCQFSVLGERAAWPRHRAKAQRGHARGSLQRRSLVRLHQENSWPSSTTNGEPAWRERSAWK